MKVLFDTNVYVAEALLGGAAEDMIAAARSASWRIFSSNYLLDEVQRVLTEELGFSKRLAMLTRKRIARRAILVDPGTSRHSVENDEKDSPILRSALKAGVDYLVTNDRVFLALHPYEGMRIISMTDFWQMLVNDGLIRPGG